MTPLIGQIDSVSGSRCIGLIPSRNGCHLMAALKAAAGKVGRVIFVKLGLRHETLWVQGRPRGEPPGPWIEAWTTSTAVIV